MSRSLKVTFLVHAGVAAAAWAAALVTLRRTR